MASDVRLKEQLPDLTNRIVATYSQLKGINHLGHCPLPRYEEVIQAIQDLTDIIFPGYRRREGLHAGNVKYTYKKKKQSKKGKRKEETCIWSEKRWL